MPTQNKRNFFSRVVTHPGDGAGGSAAVQISALMKLEGWGFIPGPNNAIGTVPSLDSFLGRNVEFIPTNTCFVGDDQFVSSAPAVGPPRKYQGLTAQGGVPFDLSEHFPPPIDTDSVWIFSSTQTIQIEAELI